MLLRSFEQIFKKKESDSSPCADSSLRSGLDASSSFCSSVDGTLSDASSPFCSSVDGSLSDASSSFCSSVDGTLSKSQV